MKFINGVRVRGCGQTVSEITYVRWVDPDTRVEEVVPIADARQRIRDGLLVRVHNPSYQDPQVVLAAESSSLTTVRTHSSEDLLLELSRF